MQRSGSDERIRARFELTRERDEAAAPSFDRVWLTAVERYESGRRLPYLRAAFASALVCALAVAVIVPFQSGSDRPAPERSHLVAPAQTATPRPAHYESSQCDPDPCLMDDANYGGWEIASEATAGPVTTSTQKTTKRTSRPLRKRRAIDSCNEC